MQQINLIRLCSKLHRLDIQKENEYFIDEINDFLFDEDLELKENSTSVLSVIFIETGGVEAEFIKLVKRLHAPILLLSNSLNNSLAATLEINSYCIDNKIPAIIMTQGCEEAANYIYDTYTVLNCANKIKNTSLGVIGEPSDWLIASKVDFPKVNDILGISLVKIGMCEFFDEYNKHKIGKVPHLKSLQKKWEKKEELKKALYCYSALKSLIDKYNLKGLTIRCFDMLGELKTTACLALGLLNEEGYVCGCEGDVPALLTMYIANNLCDLPTFMANPSKIDIREGNVLLAHCTCPLNMLSQYSLNTHFESNLGVAIEGEFPEGKVSIVKLSSDLKQYIIIEGNVKSIPHQEGYCRTQMLVNLEKDDIFRLISTPVGNHLVVCYGDICDQFSLLVNFVNHLRSKNNLL